MLSTMVSVEAIISGAARGACRCGLAFLRYRHNEWRTSVRAISSAVSIVTTHIEDESAVFL